MGSAASVGPASGATSRQGVGAPASNGALRHTDGPASSGTIPRHGIAPPSALRHALGPVSTKTLKHADGPSPPRSCDS